MGQRAALGPHGCPTPSCARTSRSAVPVVVEIDTDGNGEGDEGDEEEQLFPLVGFALLGENNEGTAQHSARPNVGCAPRPQPHSNGVQSPQPGWVWGAHSTGAQQGWGDGTQEPNPAVIPVSEWEGNFPLCLSVHVRQTSPFSGTAEN